MPVVHKVLLLLLNDGHKCVLIGRSLQVWLKMRCKLLHLGAGKGWARGAAGCASASSRQACSRVS